MNSNRIKYLSEEATKSLEQYHAAVVAGIAETAYEGECNRLPTIDEVFSYWNDWRGVSQAVRDWIDFCAKGE